MIGDIHRVENCLSCELLTVLLEYIFILCHLIHRFLTDLMDQADLIRNVVLAGHLHHGKVCRTDNI